MANFGAQGCTVRVVKAKIVAVLSRISAGAELTKAFIAKIQITEFTFEAWLSNGTGLQAAAGAGANSPGR